MYIVRICIAKIKPVADDSGMQIKVYIFWHSVFLRRFWTVSLRISKTLTAFSALTPFYCTENPQSHQENHWKKKYEMHKKYVLRLLTNQPQTTTTLNRQQSKWQKTVQRRSSTATRPIYYDYYYYYYKLCILGNFVQ